MLKFIFSVTFYFISLIIENIGTVLLWLTAAALIWFLFVVALA